MVLVIEVSFIGQISLSAGSVIPQRLVTSFSDTNAIVILKVCILSTINPIFRLNYNVSFLSFVVLEMEPRVSQMLGMHSITETKHTTLSNVFSDQSQVTVR